MLLQPKILVAQALLFYMGFKVDHWSVSPEGLLSNLH